MRIAIDGTALSGVSGLTLKTGTGDTNSASTSSTSSTATEQTAKLTGHTATVNLLENNFVQNNSEPSKYIQGVMIGFQVENALGNKMQGIIDNYQLQAASQDESNYAERVLVGKKAARAVGDVLDAEVAEKETARMKNEREDSEKETDKAQEGKAAENNGNISAAEAAGSSGEVAAPENTSGQQDGETAVAVSSDAAQQNADTAVPESGSDGGGTSNIDIVV